MKLDDAIDGRRSIRKFSSKKVRWDDVLEAIDAAIKAPFAGNLNNLKFIIVQDQELKNQLAECCQQDWIADATFIVAVCSNYKEIGKIYHDRTERYVRQHVGAAIENFLLKITDLKLTSCWVGAYTDYNIKEILEIPEDIEVEALLPVGYSKPALKIRRPRKEPLEKIIRWDTWTKKKRPGLSAKDTRTW